MRTARVWKPIEKPEFDGPILIDTHIMLWQFDGPLSSMSDASVPLITRCSRGGGRKGGIFASDISVWELGNKTAKKQLILRMTLPAWVAAVEKAPGFSFLPIGRNVLLASTSLTDAHGDPADRILIATAILYEIPLLTADASIIEYARSHRELIVFDARP